MKKIKVLVTGIGAIIGYGIIKSLRKSEYDCTIVGMDIYDDAVGKEWCDEFIQSVPAKTSEYLEFLKNIVEKMSIDLVMFGTEQEIYKVNDNRNFYRGVLSKLVINNKEILELSKDKWKTYQFLKENGFNFIKTSMNDDFDILNKELGLPMLLKPRSSYASKGIVKIDNSLDFNYWKNKNDGSVMFQEIVGDSEHEYTVAVFGLGNGEILSSIILKRKLNQEGSTSKASVVKNEMLDNEIKKICNILKPIGPTNFQFRYHKDKFLLLEINPRISSSTSIRTAFGYNEAEMCIKYFVENIVPREPIIRCGNAIRYFEDRIEYI